MAPSACAARGRPRRSAPTAAALEPLNATKHQAPMFIGERGLKTLVTLVEPALVVTFGGLVAFVAAALLQAVYAIRP